MPTLTYESVAQFFCTLKKQGMNTEHISAFVECPESLVVDVLQSSEPGKAFSSTHAKAVCRAMKKAAFQPTVTVRTATMTLSSYTHNMGPQKQRFDKFSQFFDKVVRRTNTEIDRIAFVSLFNLDRDPEQIIICASTHVSEPRRVVEDKVLEKLVELSVRDLRDGRPIPSGATAFDSHKNYSVIRVRSEDTNYLYLFVSVGANENAFEFAFASMRDALSAEFNDMRAEAFKL